MLSTVADAKIVFNPMPTARFGAGATGALPGMVRGTGSDAVAIVTDAALADTPVVPTVAGTLAANGVPATLFAGVHPTPTTDDVAAPAAPRGPLPAAAPPAPPAARGRGSPLDAPHGRAPPPANPGT